MLRQTRQSARSGVRPASSAAFSYIFQLSATTLPAIRLLLMGAHPFRPADFMVDEFMLMAGAQMGG